VLPESGWQVIEGVDAGTAQYPVSARIGDENLLVFRVGDGFRGVQSLCPHDDRPLQNARIVGDGKMIRCTYHNYTFKLDSGKGVNCPGFRVKIFEVKSEDNALFVRAAAG
jgi:nitrite reductase/ring-hydroxylating ferredoxin subunit